MSEHVISQHPDRASDLWVGCMTEDEQGTDGLVLFSATDDGWSRAGSCPLPSPAWLEQRGQFTFAALHTEHSEVVSLRLGPDGPQVVDRVATRGSDACHLHLNPAGTLLAVAHYTTGSVALVRIDAEGGLTLADLATFSGHSGADPDRQEAPHAHQAHWLADDRLLVCDLGADLVRVLHVADDRLVEDEPLALPAGFGPRHLLVRGEGADRQLAVVGELTGEVATFATEGEGWRGVGVFPGTNAGGGLPSGIRLDDRDRLWVGQRGVNTLARLDWHDDGTLGEPVETPTDGGEVRDLVLHPGHSPVTVWAALLTRDAVAAFVEQPDGTLAPGVELDVRRPAALLWTHAVGGSR